MMRRWREWKSGERPIEDEARSGLVGEAYIYDSAMALSRGWRGDRLPCFSESNGVFGSSTGERDSFLAAS